MDIQSLYQRHLDGESLRELARQVKLHPGTIAKQFREAGLPPRTREAAVALENKKRPQGVGSRGGNPSLTAAVKACQRKRLAIVRAYRTSQGCKKCGESHPAVLDLHHRDPESKHKALRSYGHTGTRKGRIGGRGWDSIALRDLEAEFAKCDVLCSNCHRITEWELKNK